MGEARCAPEMAKRPRAGAEIVKHQTHIIDDEMVQRQKEIQGMTSVQYMKL